MSTWHVKRLLYAIVEAKVEREAVRILGTAVYQGFGPTLAAEYLAQMSSDRPPAHAE